MSGNRNVFPDYGPGHRDQGPDNLFPSLFPPGENLPGRSASGKRGRQENEMSGKGLPPSSASGGTGQPKTTLPSAPLLSEEQMEAMRRRQETRWNAIGDEIAWCWDWKKVAAGWQQLIDMDRRFFPQRFREYVAEVLDNARYVPHYALEVVLGYCLHQPSAVQKMYSDLWREKLRSEKWANWQQQMVIEKYLNECHLRQGQEHLPYQGSNAGIGGGPGAREWRERMRLTWDETRDEGTFETFSCPVRKCVEIQELPEVPED